MHLRRLLRSRIIATSLLLGLCVFTLLLFGEVTRAFVVRKNGIRLQKRNGSSLTFDLPWPFVPKEKAELKALSPIIGSLLNDVGNIASAILDGGSNIANNVAFQAASVQPSAVAAAASVLPTNQVAQVSKMLAGVNSAVEQATKVLAMLVADATSAVGSMLAEATNPSNVGALGPNLAMPNANSSLTLNSTSEPEEFLTQTAISGSGGGSAHSITSAGMPASRAGASVSPTGYSFPSATAKPSACPSLGTVTCTVTETWHSTHYAQTATLFSFIASMTVTCTETVSVCPAHPIYLANIADSNDPPLVACSPGVFAKRTEDCPPSLSSPTPGHYIMRNLSMSNPCPNDGYSCSECPGGFFCPSAPAQNVPCGYGWPCPHCSNGYYCIPYSKSGTMASAAEAIVAGQVTSNSGERSGNGNGIGVGGAASVLGIQPSIAGLRGAGSVKSAESQIVESGGPNSGQSTGSSTANSGFSGLESNAAVANSRAGSFACLDGTIVQTAKDCLDGLAINGAAASVVNVVMANVDSALSGISGLTGALRGTVLADISSALSAVGAGAPKVQITGINSLIGNLASVSSKLLPSATNVGNLVSIPNNGLLDTLPTAPNNVANLLSAVTADVSNVVSQLLPTIITGGAAAIPSPGNGVGNVGNVGNVLSQVLATVNGHATDLNGVPTAVPAISQILGGGTSVAPVVAGGLNQVIGGTSNGGAAGGTTNNGLTGAIGQVVGGTSNGGVTGSTNGGLVNTLGGTSQVIGGTSNGGLTGLGNGLFGGLKRKRGSQRGKGKVKEPGREEQEEGLLERGGL